MALLYESDAGSVVASPLNSWHIIGNVEPEHCIAAVMPDSHLPDLTVFTSQNSAAKPAKGFRDGPGEKPQLSAC